MVHASSMAVYGQAVTTPVREDHPRVPASHYGASKLYGEHALAIAQQRGLSVTCLRLFSVYGPGQDLDNLSQGMVSIFLAYFLRASEVPVTGALSRVRDLVEVDDVVDAWVVAVQQHRTPSFAYNIAGGRPVTVGELLAAIQARVPRKVPISVGETVSTDQRQLWADIGLAARELGWRPKTSLERGLDRMVEWGLRTVTHE
jgi:UDP-glucose 4-epimerase